MTRIALATSRELPDLDADDHGYVRALRDRGAVVTLPVWDDPAADWGADVVVIRSTWDYSEKHGAFLAWAARVDAATKLLNPSSMVRWNTDKQRYLTDLAQQRVKTVPTTWLARSDEDVDLAAVVKDAGFGGADVVVKPIVGAGSRDTVKVAAADVATAGAAFVKQQLPQQALMVQPFLPGIADGEVSLVFIEGSYSHAVIKQPKPGDFRSQPEFGSVVARHAPTTAERDLADHALHTAGGRPLYARVDVVTDLDGKPCVIELELVEPCLYLGWSDAGAEAFAEATLRRALERSRR
jgi:glutathione synthase/RimK-type ligase-like ATP-grasp enzyme